MHPRDGVVYQVVYCGDGIYEAWRIDRDRRFSDKVGGFEHVDEAKRAAEFDASR